MSTKDIERKIFKRVNRERRKHGLGALASNDALIAAARRHSKWMSVEGRLSHTGARHTDPSRRAAAAGYSGGAGENILFTESNGSDESIAESAMKWWMRSEGHRENILSDEYLHLGVGVYRNKKGRIYMTQNFGRTVGVVAQRRPDTFKFVKSKPPKRKRRGRWSRRIRLVGAQGQQGSWRRSRGPRSRLHVRGVQRAVPQADRGRKTMRRLRQP